VRVLDTSVAVDHLRGFPAAVACLRDLIESDEEIVASEIVRFELVAGAPAEPESSRGSSGRATAASMRPIT